MFEILVTVLYFVLFKSRKKKIFIIFSPAFLLSALFRAAELQ